MKRALLFLIGICLPATLFAADARWYYDLPEAQAIARKEKKLVLVDFTGSDWCGWCKKLKQELFVTPEFNDYARTNLVLVELDFPRYKPLSPETLLRNEKLQAQYKAEGFPTLVMLNSEGKELWRQGGYAELKPAQWIMLFDQLKARAVGTAAIPKQASTPGQPGKS